MTNLIVRILILHLFLINSCMSQNDKKEVISFDEQMEIFNSLGYKFNEGINKDVIFSEMMRYDRTLKNPDSIFIEKPYERLYYYLGWQTPFSESTNYTNNCIWYDFEFIDSKSQYVNLMNRMGVITNGEIKFTDIKMSVDEENYEWINFKANGISKKWKLEKVGYISSNIFNFFAELNQELNTNGKYTYYNDRSQQFVIDYATEKEQAKFIKKTNLKRRWLSEGNH